MRILHVVPSYVPAWRYGGPIRSVHGLCRALAGRGHRVEVATTNVDGDRDSDVPLGTPVDVEGVRVHYFPSLWMRRICYSQPLARALPGLIDDCDIVHTHSVFLWPTTAAASGARLRRKPYVLSPRGMLIGDLVRRRSALAKRAWIALFERRNVEGAAAIHVTSDVERQELLAMGLHPRSIFEVPNGMDIPSDDALPPDAGPDPRLPPSYGLFLGRISWKKGLDRLLDAMAHAPDVRMVIAGNDEESLWPALARQAAALGVEGRVTRLGYVDGEAWERLVRGASFLALPSHSENFGNVVLEAMARGVPVVVTPEVGLAAEIRSSGSGVVVDGSPAALGGALASLAADPGLRAAMGRNGRVAAARFSWEAVSLSMESEYEALLR